MTSKLIFPYIISMILLVTLSSNLLAQESKQALFFQKIYGPEYDGVVKSLSTNDKINFAKKVLKNIDAFEKESYRRFTILKIIPMVDSFKSGYPVAVALMQKLVSSSHRSYQLKHLPRLCHLQGLLAKSIPSSQKNKKADAFGQLLKSQVLLAKLFFEGNQFKDSSEVLKQSQQTARYLKLKKTISKIKDVMKVLTSKVTAERLYHQKVSLLKSNGKDSKTLIWVGEYILSELGDLTLAVPYALKAPQGPNFSLIEMYRKSLAAKTKASKAPLYFTDRDLDLPNELLFEYLTVPEETSAKSSELRARYWKKDNKAVLELLTLGENFIDAGKKVSFGQQAELAQKLMVKIKTIKNPNAQKKLLKVLSQLVKNAIYGELELDDAQEMILKILDKDINALGAAILENKLFIDFDTIPTDIIKPKLFDLVEGLYIKQGLMIQGLKHVKGLDISNPKNVKKHARLFQLKSALGKQPNQASKWAKVNHKLNTKDFFFKAQAGKCSVFHSYLISKKSQSLSFDVVSANLGTTKVFLNGKLMKMSVDKTSHKFEIKLSKKQYMLRIVFFHGERSNEGSFRIAIKASKKGQKLDLKTSNLSLN